MINKKALKMLLPVTLVAIGVCAATPISQGVARSDLVVASGEITRMTAEFSSIEDVGENVVNTIRPTLVNTRNLVYSSKNYDDFRTAYGKSENWMNKMSADGETFKERIEKQIAADSKAVTNLVTAIKLVSTSQTKRGQYRVTDYVMNHTDTLKFDSKYLSKDLAFIAADPLQAAIAFHNRRYFHGVLPSEFIFNSYGKYTLKRELDMTVQHLLRHQEYWFEFILVDDFFAGRVGDKVQKFNYIYE